MIIQTLRRHSILSLTTTLVAVMLCAAPIAYAQTKDTTATEIEQQVGGTPAVDMNVTKKVRSALALDTALSAFDIAIVTTKGDVRLTGKVDTQLQINQIVSITRAVEGVKSVHDELTLKP
jgi:osmotically-inducible protein OsmY